MFSIILVLQAASLTVSPTDGAYERARPVGTPADWFVPDGYPPSAMRLGEQGRTGIILTIDERGTIIASSGSAALDDATCALAQKNGRFEPAIDASGRPAKSRFTTAIRWALPPSAFKQRQSFSQVTRIAIDADGVVQSCKSDVTGALPASIGDGCVQFGHGSPQFFKQLKGKLADMPAVVTVQMILRFDGDPPMVEEYRAAGSVAVAVGRAAFNVRDSGQVADCHSVSHEGTGSGMPLCSQFLGPFAPAPTSSRATVMYAFSSAPPKP